MKAQTVDQFIKIHKKWMLVDITKRYFQGDTHKPISLNDANQLVRAVAKTATLGRLNWADPDHQGWGPRDIEYYVEMAREREMSDFGDAKITKRRSMKEDEYRDVIEIVFADGRTMEISASHLNIKVGVAS